MIATGQPREVAAHRQRDEPAHDEDLVGERVEERAGASGAVAPGQPAVEPVGDPEHPPAHERGPRLRAGLAVEDHHEHRDREEQPHDGDDVGRRADRVGPEPGTRGAGRCSPGHSRDHPARTGRGRAPRWRRHRRSCPAPGGRRPARAPRARRRRSPAPPDGCGRPRPSAVPSTSTSSGVVSATSASRAACVIADWTSSHSRSRSAIRASGTRRSSVAAACAVLGREREEAGPVEARPRRRNAAARRDRTRSRRGSRR